VSRVEADKRLDTVGTVLTRVTEPLLDRRSLAAILRGDFMGHALHPLLTDVPIGAWLSAAVLDVAGGTQSQAAATRLTGVGLVAAVPTVASGLVELASTGPADRRVGATHAMFNAAAAGCYLISYVQRRRGQHGRAVGMSLAAATLLGVGGYLGGHLAVVRKVGTASPDWSDAG
jgi:uncharacterized membrane protein